MYFYIFLILKLVGCDKSKKITIWESYEPFNHIVFFDVAKDFYSKTGIMVDVVRLNTEELEDKIFQGIKSNNLPDIGIIELNLFNRLKNDGELAEIEIEKNILTEELLIPFTDGKITYGLPDLIIFPIIFYKEKINIEKLKEAKKIDELFPKIVELSENKRININRKIFFPNQYSMDTMFNLLGENEIELGFISCKYSIIIEDWNKILKLKNYNISFNVLPLPINDSIYLKGKTFVIFKKSKNYKIAKRFLEFIYSDEIQNFLSTRLYKISPNQFSLNDERVKKILENFSTKKFKLTMEE